MTLLPAQWLGKVAPPSRRLSRGRLARANENQRQPPRMPSVTEPALAGESRVHCQRSLYRVLLFVLLSVSLAAARDIALISNKTNSVATIAVPDLVKLCKAQTTRWPDGKPITFVMRAP